MDFLCTNPFGRIANPPSVDITSSYCLADWREDLKKVLLYAGVTGAPCVFLVADTQLKSEAFLEDVNNILNTGARQLHSHKCQRICMLTAHLHACSLPTWGCSPLGKKGQCVACSQNSKHTTR